MGLKDWREWDLAHSLIGVMLGGVAGVAVSLGLVAATTDPPLVLDPVPAYCHGVADGMRHAMEINRVAFEYAEVRLPEDADAFQVEQENDCIRLLDEAMAGASWLRGPLQPSTDDTTTSTTGGTP